jgi:DNA invertase Pin-like site-specific DNA recombinase
MKIGYARVSTQEQTLDLQIDALKKYGCENIFTDKVSGLKAHKPEFEEMMKFVEKEILLLSGNSIVWGARPSI